MIATVATWGVVAPAVIAIVALHLAERGRGQQPRAAAVGAALAFGAAYVAASLGMNRGLAAGPEGRLLAVACLATGLGLVEARWAVPGWLRGTLRIVASVSAAALLVQPLVGPQQWGLAAVAWRLGAIAAANLLAWIAIGALARTERGASLAAGLGLLAASSAAVILLAGLAAVGQLVGAVTAALGAATLLLWMRPGDARLHGAAPVIALLIVGHLSVGMLYGEMPAASYLLLAAAPLSLFAAQVLSLRRSAARAATVAARLLAVGALASAAVAISARAYFGGQLASDTAPVNGAAVSPDDDYVD